MKRSVSKTRYERMGWRQFFLFREKSASFGGRKPQTFAESYQEILTRELLINDFQESHSKYF